MPRLLPHYALLAVLGLLTGVNGGASAQAVPSCYPDTAARTSMTRRVTRVATAPSTNTEMLEARTKLQIPAVDATSVTIVTSSSTCLSAAKAVSSRLGRTPPGGRSVVVVKVGTVYVVKDPLEKAGEFTRGFVFDSKWRFRSGYLD